MPVRGRNTLNSVAYEPRKRKVREVRRIVTPVRRLGGSEGGWRILFDRLAERFVIGIYVAGSTYG